MWFAQFLVEDDNMRRPTIVLLAVIAVPGWAEGKNRHERHEQFIDTKPSKFEKFEQDYYVVRKGDRNRCAIEPGVWGERPADAVGDVPYASKAYAKAALKTFSECKGGETD
jgi:hypothetical protein